ncbi:MAG: fructose-bisphosphate aldolase [Thermoprotei archaeon]|nr:MAG: fructose-bisphosphate aldolase [Thermoprotei archaeon]RLF24340.1 MAG: fructose-bisphosphate aldolase [Thermoprotei archaeon]
MSVVGKYLRLGRIFRRSTKRTVIIALDHGRRHGPIKGIEDLRATVSKVLQADVDAVMVTIGMIRHVYDEVAGRAALIARIDGTGTIKGPDPTDDRLIASIERAIKLGADAVSIMVYIGSRNEAALLEKMGIVAESCDEYGMPLLAEIIPSKPFIKEPYAPESVAYCSRIGAEYGADVIKTYYTGDPKSFREVTSRVPVPIVVLGGPRKETIREVLEMVKGSIEGGGSGVAIGRNVFQFDDPTAMAQAIVEIVHKNRGVKEVMESILGMKQG